MSEQKERIQKSAEKPAEKVRKIKCEGPIHETNGASIFRLQKQRGSLDIYPGQILTIGNEITKDEAEQLLAATSWKFSEVK